MTGGESARNSLMRTIEVKILDSRLREQLPTYATPGSAAT